MTGSDEKDVGAAPYEETVSVRLDRSELNQLAVIAHAMQDRRRAAATREDSWSRRIGQEPVTKSEAIREAIYLAARVLVADQLETDY